jgi:hypothetical protein
MSVRVKDEGQDEGLWVAGQTKKNMAETTRAFT